MGEVRQSECREHSLICFDIRNSAYPLSRSFHSTIPSLNTILLTFQSFSWCNTIDSRPASALSITVFRPNSFKKQSVGIHAYKIYESDLRRLEFAYAGFVPFVAVTSSRQSSYRMLSYLLTRLL